jgi:hypothetical protein
VEVSLPGLPRSGVASVALKSGGQADIPCAASSTSSYTCTLPSTSAPAAAETVLAFSVAVTSFAGAGASAGGARRFDDLPPSISTAHAIPYPGGSGPLAWGHDGAHFNLRDSGTLYTFSAWDCGSGVKAVSNLTLTPQPSSRSVSLADSGARQACGNGVSAIIYDVAVQADLSTTAPGSFNAADNLLSIGVSVVDGPSNGAGGVVARPATASKEANVTRRLWRASVPPGVSSLALGPQLFASGSGGLYALAPLSGAQGTWTASATGAATIAFNNGTPAVVYAQGNSIVAGNAAQLTSSTFGTCSKGDTLDGFGLVDQSIISFSSQSQVATGTCDHTCSIADNCPGKTQCSQCPACWNFRTDIYQSLLTLSDTSVTCSVGTADPGSACSGSPGGPASLSSRVSSALPSLLYIGQDGNNSWAVTDPSGTPLGTYGAPLAAAHGWPVVDGSSPPMVYLPGVLASPGRVDVLRLGAGGFGAQPFSLPLFPNTIADMLLARNGILYVLSGNMVHAVITDSAGGGTAAGGVQTTGWPSACRDPCRSSSPEYACPY